MAGHIHKMIPVQCCLSSGHRTQQSYRNVTSWALMSWDISLKNIYHGKAFRPKILFQENCYRGFIRVIQQTYLHINFGTQTACSRVNNKYACFYLKSRAVMIHRCIVIYQHRAVNIHIDCEAKNCVMIHIITSYIIVYSQRNLNDTILHFIY